MSNRMISPYSSPCFPFVFHTHYGHSGSRDGEVILRLGGSEQFRAEKGPCATQPRAKTTPDPNYTKEAYDESCSRNHPSSAFDRGAGWNSSSNITVLRGLSDGLNDEAVTAVKSWRFEPGTIEGKLSVPVQIDAEVNFRLNRRDNSVISWTGDTGGRGQALHRGGGCSIR